HSDPMSAFRYIVSQLSPKRFTINYADRSYK
ncbi:MAG: S-adenosylmethionine decarboxylase proenzyme, partial [Pyrobaculum sp.]